MPAKEWRAAIQKLEDKKREDAQKQLVDKIKEAKELAEQKARVAVCELESFLNSEEGVCAKRLLGMTKKIIVFGYYKEWDIEEGGDHREIERLVVNFLSEKGFCAADVYNREDWPLCTYTDFPTYDCTRLSLKNERMEDTSGLIGVMVKITTASDKIVAFIRARIDRLAEEILQVL